MREPKRKIAYGICRGWVWVVYTLSTLGCGKRVHVSPPPDLFSVFLLSVHGHGGLRAAVWCVTSVLTNAVHATNTWVHQESRARSHVHVTTISKKMTNKDKCSRQGNRKDSRGPEHETSVHKLTHSFSLYVTSPCPVSLHHDPVLHPLPPATAYSRSWRVSITAMLMGSSTGI